MLEYYEEHEVGEKLVQAALNRDEGAFSSLYNDMYGTLGDVVFRTLYKKTLVKEGASDVIQEAFVRAWEQRQELREQNLAGFQGWLIAIVRNLAHDRHEYWRRGVRNIDREGRDGGLEDVVAAIGPSSSHAARIELIWRAMDELPAAQREAVRLQKFEGCSRGEIADRLGRSEESVQGLLKRGKRKLAESLRRLDSEISERGR